MSDEQNPTGAAPVRARSGQAQEGPTEPIPQPPLDILANQHPLRIGHEPRRDDDTNLPEDIRVPWGWPEIVLLIVLGIVASAVLTWGVALIAVRIFGVPKGEVFGASITTAKSIVLLVSQALLDLGAILYLYLMLAPRTTGRFWPEIGWREMRPGTGSIRESVLQYVGAGAALAVLVSFVGGFFNPNKTLPIEELLKARSSILLFGILGVVLAPVVEETVFRGFLYPVIARRWGITTGIIATGTLFGLMHAAQLWGGWGQIALLIMVGLALTWVRARTGTVVASYFMHVGYNGLQLAGYLVYLASRWHHGA